MTKKQYDQDVHAQIRNVMTSYNFNSNVWVTSDGRYIRVQDLGDQHLNNIIRKLRRYGYESELNGTLPSLWFHKLQKEQLRRQHMQLYGTVTGRHGHSVRVGKTSMGHTHGVSGIRTYDRAIGLVDFTVVYPGMPVHIIDDFSALELRVIDSITELSNHVINVQSSKVKEKEMSASKLSAVAIGSMQEGYCLVEIQFPGDEARGRKYTYKYDLRCGEIAVNDHVVVNVGIRHTAVVVHKVITDLEEIDNVTARIGTLKWIVDKVDSTYYHERNEQEEEAQKLYRRMKANQARKKAFEEMNVMFADVDVQAVDAFSNILKPGKENGKK